MKEYDTALILKKIQKAVEEREKETLLRITEMETIKYQNALSTLQKILEEVETKQLYELINKNIQNTLTQIQKITLPGVALKQLQKTLDEQVNFAKVFDKLQKQLKIPQNYAVFKRLEKK